MCNEIFSLTEYVCRDNNTDIDAELALIVAI